MNILKLKQFSLVLLTAVCLMTAFPVIGADAPKPYSPFDESKPKIPDEILADKRLDAKVKVFVKSKNFKHLFTELSEVTGLKISATRELWGERALVYFHNRPVRDVMTEVSDLYGFCWRVKGKEGDYQYEMYEDMRRVERRKKLVEEQKKAEDAALMAFIHQYFDESKREEMLARVRQADLKDGLFTSLDGDNMSLQGFFPKFGEDFFRDVLAKQNVTLPLADLPQGAGDALGEWLTKTMAERNDVMNSEGMGSVTTPFEREDLKEVTISFTRQSSDLGIAQLYYEVRTPRDMLFSERWPNVYESALHAAMNTDRRDRVQSEKPLPDKPGITVKKTPYPYTLPGEVLQAIGNQSDFDAIADYHFDAGQIGLINGQALSKVVRSLCDSCEYICRFDGSTLRFAREDLHRKELMEEPPAKMIEGLWAKLGTSGQLDIQDLLDLVNLPGRQSVWPGLRFIPGADIVRRRQLTLRLWASLSPKQVQYARSSEGLPVAQLSAEQRAVLDPWVTALKVDMSAGFEEAVIRLPGDPSGLKPTDLVTVQDGSSVPAADAGWAPDELFVLQLPDARKYEVSIPFEGLSKQVRANVIAMRKADAEADVIEMVE